MCLSYINQFTNPIPSYIAVDCMKALGSSLKRKTSMSLTLSSNKSYRSDTPFYIGKARKKMVSFHFIFYSLKNQKCTGYRLSSDPENYRDQKKQTKKSSSAKYLHGTPEEVE